MGCLHRNYSKLSVSSGKAKQYRTAAAPRLECALLKWAAEEPNKGVEKITAILLSLNQECSLKKPAGFLMNTKNLTDVF